MDSATVTPAILLLLALAFGLFLLIRIFWLWYFRIDHRVKLMDKMISNQQTIIDAMASQHTVQADQLTALRGIMAQNRAMIEAAEETSRNGRDLVSDLSFPE